MTTELLKAGLWAVRINVEAECEDRFTIADVDAAIKEIESLEQVLKPDSDIWHNECYVVGAEHAYDVTNIIAYDTYGKLARQTNNHVTAERFIKAVRSDIMCDVLWSVSDSFLSEAMLFVHDLWADNEYHENNNPDGTFHRAQ